MYGFAQSLGNDTACNTTCGHFQRTVDTYEQYHEYQRVYIAESLVQTLDVICVPEQQNQCAHEEQGVQECCQETACKITEGIVRSTLWISWNKTPVSQPMSARVGTHTKKVYRGLMLNNALVKALGAVST